MRLKVDNISVWLKRCQVHLIFKLCCDIKGVNKMLLFFLLFSSFKWYCVSQKKLRPGCASTDNSTTSSGNQSFLQWNLCEQMIYSRRQRNFEQLSHTGQLWSSWRHESVQLTSYKPAMIMRNESNMEKACCSITRHASCRFIAEVGFSLHVKTRR